MEQPPDNGVDLTLWGGLVGGLGGTALGGGGALGFFIGGPAAEIEVGGDYSPGINGADVRVTSPFVDSNAFSVGTSALFFAHGSFTYNFHLETSRAVPYASGGLVYMRTSEETTFFDNSWSASITGSAMAPQFGGGIKLPIGGGDTYFRGDIRFYLFDGAKATRVNAGVTF